jgi:Rad3-related DNA helicase
MVNLLYRNLSCRSRQRCGHGAAGSRLEEGLDRRHCVSRLASMMRIGFAMPESPFLMRSDF